MLLPRLLSLHRLVYKLRLKLKNHHQIALVLGISITGAFFRQVKSKKTKNGIKREKFILLINLGYDKFESTEEIDEIVEEGKFSSLAVSKFLEYFFR